MRYRVSTVNLQKNAAERYAQQINFGEVNEVRGPGLRRVPLMCGKRMRMLLKDVTTKSTSVKPMK